MRKLVYLVVAAATLAIAGAAVADSPEEKEKVKSKGVTWTTQAGGDGYAEFKVYEDTKSNKPVRGSTVVVKVNNPTTPVDLNVNYGGKVECVEQTGNQAVFSGLRDDGSGKYFRISVQDNGKKSGDPPDRIRVQDTRTSADCSTIPVPFNDVLTGDIKVD